LEPAERRQAVGWLIENRSMTVTRACRVAKLVRSSWYRPPRDRVAKDAPIMDALNEVLASPVRSRWGFWKCHDWLRNKGRGINHKPLWRVYKAMKLNIPRRRAKKRLPTRDKQPLAAPPVANKQWSMDFMEDSLYCGRRFRTLNLFDEGTREVLAIEIDTSLPAARVIRVLEQLKENRKLPAQIRVDNGPEFVSAKLNAWCDTNQIKLQFTQPGRPMQNGYVERFNGSFRTEILDAFIFGSLDEARELAHEWMICYNYERPHDALNGIPPALFREKQNQLTNQNNHPYILESSILHL
jgi:putative transposase